ncbi:helix-hairpin-helix domain-containing protein [Tsukamurella sp. 8F]|uniref:helix-hairpin-helix domain-containing protein n=1 Tax=unclassified Tsukamurella TaxID=2633480 RepID=UPI0023B97F62|nr:MULTISPECIES: helix-hairpin-helix domain-containing protein [unclassified Tsukamurella]MDF0532245.1 helix-hairpin-helix domain-containing protein [Tsukamurella sp. 8J]MDF0588057.1 helix-hairpin-helix domain-containing protein [Tsukamurella sp. 8F]
MDSESRRAPEPGDGVSGVSGAAWPVGEWADEVLDGAAGESEAGASDARADESGGFTGESDGRAGVAVGRAGEPEEFVAAEPEWLRDFGPRSARQTDQRRDDGWDEGWGEPSDTGWRGVLARRVRSTPRTALGLAAVGIVAVLVALYAVATSPAAPDQYPVVDFGASAAATSSASVPEGSGRASTPTVSSSAAPAAHLTVAVVGLVRRPGPQRLAPGARVADALSAAGGAVHGADTAGIDLDRSLRDGDEVVIGARDRERGLALRSAVLPAAVSAAPVAGASGAVGASASSAPGPLVDINSASAAELDVLPGVGAATAAAIVAYREQHGAFASVDDLVKVNGIGEAKLARIRPQATV